MKRHEIKFPTYSRAKMQEALRLMQMTVAYPPRIVHSIYLDSGQYRLYLESHEGIAPRKKIRLRWYDQENFLQKGTIETKISYPHFREKLSQKYNFAKDSTLEEIIKNIPDESLKPVLHVRYKRAYYINRQDIRATIDTDIQYQQIHEDGSIDIKRFTDPSFVLEIKANLDKVRDDLSKDIPIQMQRFSKYCRGLEQAQICNAP